MPGLRCCSLCGSMSGVTVEPFGDDYVAWCQDCWNSDERYARACIADTEDDALDGLLDDEEAD